MTPLQQTKADQKERDLLKELDKGIHDMKQGRVISHDDAMKRLKEMVRADVV